MTTTEAYKAAQEHPEIVEQGQKALQEMMARSTTDPDFRQKLLASPREAFAEFAGRDVSEIPETFNVVFVENKADFTFVLPEIIDEHAELSEEDLETVAGGVTPTVALVGSYVAGVAVAGGIYAGVKWINSQFAE